MVHRKPDAEDRPGHPFVGPAGRLLDLQPAIIVCLGATAAKALPGAAFRITLSRGVLQKPPGLPPVIATFHPSYLLRLKDRPGGEEAYGLFVADLRKASSCP